MNWVQEIKWDDQGLVPAIIQDNSSKEVLMLAYMNEQSLNKTLETGETWFWSRSRQEYWNKGATSGNKQAVQEVRYDCDMDTILVLVDPAGSACHTGAYQCFYRKADDSSKSKTWAAQPAQRYQILNALEAMIATRDAERPKGAYTTYLFDHGLDKILKKIGEEATEVVIAAKNREPDELRMETADLLYHLLVLLREQRMPIDEVLAELTARHGQTPRDPEGNAAASEAIAAKRAEDQR